MLTISYNNLEDPRLVRHITVLICLGLSKSTCINFNEETMLFFSYHLQANIDHVTMLIFFPNNLQKACGTYVENRVHAIFFPTFFSTYFWKSLYQHFSSISSLIYSYTQNVISHFSHLSAGFCISNCSMFIYGL